MTTKGVWNLQQVRDQILASAWVVYDPSKDPGELWGWGRNNYGQLGTNNTVPNRSSPVQISGTTWTTIAPNNDLSFSIKTDGTLWAWGRGLTGRLGLNDNITRSSPTQIPGNQWIYVSSGNLSAAALKSDNTLWTWGSNSNGTLGDNTVITRSSPTQIPGNQWNNVGVQLSSGHILATKTDGTLWAWGRNNLGQLGLRDIINRSSPVQIPGNNWSNDLVLGSYYSFATKTDGTLWGWGQNSGSIYNGVLGLNSAVNVSSPVQVPGTGWVSLASFAQTHAVKTDGTLWSWGYNGQGRLGDNTVIPKSSPTQIPGTSWSKAAAGRNGLGVKSDGTLWSWGYGGDGQLGLNTSLNISSPRQIPGTKWTDVSAGAFSVFAKKSI